MVRTCGNFTQGQGPSIAAEHEEKNLKINNDCRRGVVGRVTVFHAGGPGSIPGRVRIFNSYLGSEAESTQPREDN
mgnify:CR=1 FL=1